jgi:hypothetical protein
LRPDFRTVRVADAGPAHGAEQDRVGGFGAAEGLVGQRFAGVAVVEGAGGERFRRKAEAVALAEWFQHGEGRLRDLDADPVAGQDRHPDRVAARHGRLSSSSIVARAEPDLSCAKIPGREDRP